MKSPNYKTNFDTGTLNVVLANKKFIVVASDSRRTIQEGYSDDCKKVFLIGKKRALAIAGFAGASKEIKISKKIIVNFPKILQELINKFKDRIDFYDFYEWNNKVLSIGFTDRQGEYFWWQSITGNLHFLADLVFSYKENETLELKVVGLHTGYLDNGDIKIEKLEQKPIKRIGQWGRTQYLVEKYKTYRISKDVLWETSGADTYAKSILKNTPEEIVAENLESFPKIKYYLDHFDQNPLHAMGKQDLIELSTQIIQFTAKFKKSVGFNPIQIAVISKEGNSEISDHTFFDPELINISGISGCIYSEDYSFEGCNYKNFINCVIKNNKIPLPLDYNFFYGTELNNATLEYSGGDIYFGENNTVKNCRIIIKNNVNTTKLDFILKNYTGEINLLNEEAIINAI